ncbi:MAG: threonylcarbamoyl-AMP synthase [Lachnospiraceae bacterium]|nr:threonylcarbamoyl-AMP synthase [Lachnospiraceae bacterium]
MNKELENGQQRRGNTDYPDRGQYQVITHLVEAVGYTEEDAAKLKSLLKQPSDCLRAGGLVAFPTETVYGLGADALNPSAAGRIYAAKGRPSDNPLIVHISKVEDMEDLAYTNDLAYTLAQAFWPGPLTMILPKKQIVPDETTGGLDTVAIRMPAHPAALELIRQSGVYVAAPSANVSGRPSPTKASHVMEDMDGKIEYIIDGGPVGIGIESTIVDLSVEAPVILRPGFITRKMLEEMIGEVKMDAALEKPMAGIPPKAPGMKYTHYAPRGELTLVEAQRKDSDDQSREAVTVKICALAEEKRQKGFLVGIMAAEETLCCYKGKADILVCIGNRKEKNTIAAGLYAALREFDAAGAEYIYAESFRGEGISYAIMNRLLKAAGQRVIRI